MTLTKRISISASFKSFSLFFLQNSHEHHRGLCVITQVPTLKPPTFLSTLISPIFFYPQIISSSSSMHPVRSEVEEVQLSTASSVQTVVLRTSYFTLTVLFSSNRKHLSLISSMTIDFFRVFIPTEIAALE